MRKPYFKQRNKCWYVTDPRSRREVRLDPDEDRAFELWREMLDGATKAGPSATYRRLAEEFLQHNFEDRPRFKQDAKRIASFAKFLGLKKARDVSRRDVVEWLDAKKPGRKWKDKTTGEWCLGPEIRWAQKTKKDAFDAINRVFRWSIQQGLLPSNPIAGLRIKAGRSRSATITPEQHQKLLEESDPHFRHYLVACSRGPRPRQVREVEAFNVLPDFSAWVFYEHKTDSDDKPLVVYLDPCLRALTMILVAARPSGKLFRNSKGGEWRKDTVVQKMARLRKKLGLPANVINYAYRHTFATNALLKGVDIATVAELLGHKDTRMVSRVYGHLDQHKKHLNDAVNKAMGG